MSISTLRSRAFHKRQIGTPQQKFWPARGTAQIEIENPTSKCRPCGSIRGQSMSKANLGKGLMTLNPVKYWPHWSAILKEKESGQKYAVDRWPFDQGENAAVVKVEDWYIKDRE